jgi:hypothetical protein
MEPIAIRYVLTRQSILELNWVANLRVIIVVSVLAAFAVLVGLGTGDTGSVFSVLAVAALINLGLPLLGLYQVRSWTGEPVEVAFTDDGIRQDSFDRHFQGDWSAVKSFKRRLGFLLISLRGGGTFGIPVTVFASPAQVETLLSIARERVTSTKQVTPTQS